MQKMCNKLCMLLVPASQSETVLLFSAKHGHIFGFGPHKHLHDINENRIKFWKQRLSPTKVSFSSSRKIVSVQLGATCPHLALVLGSQRVDELLHAERLPHQHCDPLWRDPQLQLTGSHVADRK